MALKVCIIMNQLPFERREQGIIVRKEANTDPELGCRPEDRSTEEILNYGVINLNKPKGPTSHMVADYVKNIFHLQSAGHGGTLDPGVTGVLPVALGRATRIVQTLLTAGKEYVGIMHLHTQVEHQSIRDVFASFVGKMMQLPPVRSAVKRQLREREVYYFDILEIEGNDVLFKVGCQAGTYIRKLCVDVGRKLGTRAHMAELVRTKAGPFCDKDWVTLQDLQDAMWYYENEKQDKFLRKCIVPVEFAVKHLPKIWVQDTTVDALCRGASLALPGVAKYSDDIVEGMVAIFTLKDELIMVGEAVMSSKQIGASDRGIVAKSHKVFMKPCTYVIV
jgi:H/ACA ribonucleoprotein complex subunit 4